MAQVHPPLNEVLKYADGQITYHISEYCRTAGAYIPEEQKEEIAQSARMRIFVAYEKIDPEKGWKTFVQQHCFGAVRDYMTRGKGFEEYKWVKQADENEPFSLKFREAGPTNEDDETFDVDQIISLHIEDDRFRVEMPNVEIKWDLLARLCSVYPDLHIFVRHCLLDQQLTQMTQHFNLTRERLGQRMSEFIKTLDDCEYFNDKWTSQIIYALGLCQYFNQAEVDQGCGWSLEPVDFTKPILPSENEPLMQLSFFDDESNCET